MAEDTAPAPATVPSPLENAPVTASEAAKSTDAAAETEATSNEAVAPPADKDSAAEKPAEAPTVAEPEKPAESADSEMKDAEPSSAPTEGAKAAQPEEAAAATAAGDETATPTKSSKDKSRRKSTGTPGIKNLKKKGSMARILHLDCQPGDHYFVKTKGYTKWPAIISDDEMLPQQLIKSRPVTAKREDGSYREDFAEGGKRVADRTYPVMYLETNEFAWVRNTDLHELDPKTVLDSMPTKVTKALESAYHLAAEAHPLDFYKEILRKHQEDALAEQQMRLEEEERARQAKEAKEAEKAAKAQATPAKKSHKKKAKPAEGDDVEMADADEEEGSETAKKSSKKRKAEESAETPQRTDSVKKPKIKLTTSSTPKTTNGTASTPKTKDESKSAKSKSKKSSAATADEPEKEMAVPKEPEYTPEEKYQRKEKEVLFLRHKLQRGLLTKDQVPKEEEVKTLSDYITKLEAFPDLEVSIIRTTKINKVLKAILKLASIPKEEEFDFKGRSQKILDQWNKLLTADEKPSGEAANGVNGSSAEPSKKSPEPAKAKTNGVKEASEGAPEVAKDSEKELGDAEKKESEDKSQEKAEEKPAEESKEPEAVAV